MNNTRLDRQLYIYSRWTILTGAPRIHTHIRAVSCAHRQHVISFHMVSGQDILHLVLLARSRASGLWSCSRHRHGIKNLVQPVYPATRTASGAKEQPLPEHGKMDGGIRYQVIALRATHSSGSFVRDSAV